MGKKLTRIDLQAMKQDGKRAVWITAYDYWTANFAEQAGMDMILVGDSLGMCIYGYSGTVPVTMDQCICHCEAVRRGAANTFVIGDMPFLSYQVSVPDAVRNAGRFHKEAGVDAIKLEGGSGSAIRFGLLPTAACWSWDTSGSPPRVRGSRGDSRPRAGQRRPPKR
jgi:3-methyl-2-oxobutanoate hydroxymethyltransferase